MKVRKDILSEIGEGLGAQFNEDGQFNEQQIDQLLDTMLVLLQGCGQIGFDEQEGYFWYSPSDDVLFNQFWSIYKQAEEKILGGTDNVNK